MIALNDRLEFATERDKFFNYCLWEYQPRAPHANKFRSVNLLFHSFEVAGVGDAWFDLVGMIRNGIGDSQTVWGVKLAGGALRWEFYFYDYKRRERTRSMSRLIETIRPLVRCDVKPDEGLPYFMFSVDVPHDLPSGAAVMDEIHMYVGNVGSSVSSGICYSVRERSTTLENFYFFFDAAKQMEAVRGKVASSAYLDSSRIPLEAVLWPELATCRVIVVANKKQNDAVYFAGINVDQLLFFLRRMGYPPALVAFVEQHRSDLDHLEFDVGIDYRTEGDRVVFLKSGYYGIF
jgi:hypothetical protein